MTSDCMLIEAAKRWAVEHPEDICDRADDYSTTSSRFLEAAESAYFKVLVR